MKHPQWDLQPAVTDFTDEEQKEFLRLVKKLGWQRTGKDNFEAIMFSIFPAVPSEQAVVCNINGVDHVLMWHRDDEHYKGWHMPGGYLLRGESDFDWCARVLKKENGLELKKIDFIRRFNTRPDTGWVPGQQMAHFWLCEVEGEPTNGKFYPLTALPENTLGHHRKYVDCLRAFLMRRETMQKNGIWYDGQYRAPEWKWLVQIDGRHEVYRTIQVCDSFDEAIALYRKANPKEFIVSLYDDQGKQIL